MEAKTKGFIVGKGGLKAKVFDKAHKKFKRVMPDDLDGYLPNIM